MALVAKRTVMNLYSDRNDAYSHQVRIVLAEKGVNVEIQNIEPNNIPEEIFELNPYGTVPVLVDRELVLFQANIIMEYLDERFPHPPLLPVYPVARAESRKIMYRIERDWYSQVELIKSGTPEEAKAARTQLRDSLVGLEPVFANQPYFLSEDFSLIDCVLAPLLWRLPTYGIDLPSSAKALNQYMERVFSRPSFKVSLSEVEKEWRVA